MSRFAVYSAQGVKKYEGKPSFVGSYLKVGVLEFREISSPFPILWEVGDYVDYSRTGLRYKLYSIPEQNVTKQARAGEYGAAFVYHNVQFFDPTKMLELAPFRDLVRGDNRIHFSTMNSIAVWDDVYGIAERIGVSLEEMYPGMWEVNVVDTEDEDLLETLHTELNYTVEGVSCLGALDKIYELWNNIGWTYSVSDEGKHVITIGGADVRTADNTAPEFTYGMGNGLVTLERNVANKDEVATRLFVYGSSRNMLSRYYNKVKLPIKDQDSIDIQHLMLPIEPIPSLEWNGWGKTDGEYDPSKAFVDDMESRQKNGLIVKSVYFDGSENEEIYPSLKDITIGEVRNYIGSPSKAGYPKERFYPDPSERIDLIKDAVNPDDNGTVSQLGEKYTKTIDIHIDSIDTSEYDDSESLNESLVYLEAFHGKEGRVTFNLGNTGYLHCQGRVLDSLILYLSFYNSTGYKDLRIQTIPREDSANPGWYYYDFTLPELEVEKDGLGDILNLQIKARNPQPSHKVYSFHVDALDSTVGFEITRGETFWVSLKQIGFNINDRARLGEGKATILMTSGMCAGRSFLVKECRYRGQYDDWQLMLWRQNDDSVGMWYPNNDFPILAGDSFVLLDIAMPDMYIAAAEQKLLLAGRRMLTGICSPTPVFTPKVDSKVVREYQNAHGTELSPLVAGNYLHIADSDLSPMGNEYVLIDTVTINEAESNIATYTITLREKKKVTINESLSASIGDMSSSVKSLSSDEVFEYLQRSEFDELFQKERTEDGETRIRAKYGLYSDSFISAGGIGTGGGGGEGGATTLNELNDVELSHPADGDVLSYDNGAWRNKELDLSSKQDILVSGENIKTINGISILGDGNIDVHSGEGGVTMEEVDAEIDSKLVGYAKEEDIPSLDGYATESWVEGKGYLTEHQDISNLATKDEVSAVESKIPTVPTKVSAFENDADYATKSDIPTVPTNVSAFTNDVGYLTEHQSLADYAKKEDIPDVSGLATKGEVEDVEAKIPTIPTNVSAFANDAGYLTEHQSLDEYAKKSELPVVPTKVSEFTNDAGYLTEHQTLKTINEETLVGEGDIEVPIAVPYLDEMSAEEEIAEWYNTVNENLDSGRAIYMRGNTAFVPLTFVNKLSESSIRADFIIGSVKMTYIVSKDGDEYVFEMEGHALEETSNKVEVFTVGNTTDYPSTAAVVNYTQNNYAALDKKQTTITDNNVNYPSSGAVVRYVADKAPGKDGTGAYGEWNINSKNISEGTSTVVEEEFWEKAISSDYEIAEITKLKGNTINWNQWVINSLRYETSALAIRPDGGCAAFLTIKQGGATESLPYSQAINVYAGRKYAIVTDGPAFINYRGRYYGGVMGRTELFTATSDGTIDVAIDITNASAVGDYNLTIALIDLTQMLGSGNERIGMNLKSLVLAHKEYNEGTLVNFAPAAITYANGVTWNQHIYPFEEANRAKYMVSSGVSFSEGVATLSGDGYATFRANKCALVSGQKWLVIGNAQSDEATGIFQFGAEHVFHITSTSTLNVAEVITITSGDVASNVLNHSIVVGTNTANHASVRCWGVQAINLTQMFGAGNEPRTHAEFLSRSPEVESPNAYDEGTFIGESGRRMIPVKTLRSTEGEVIFPDGLKRAGYAYDEIVGNKAIRRVGTVALSELTIWQATGPNDIFTFYCPTCSNIPDSVIGVSCDALLPITQSEMWNNGGSGIALWTWGNMFCIRIDGVSNVTQASAWLNEHPVNIYYALETPIEYEIENNSLIEIPAPKDSVLRVEGFSAPLHADVKYITNSRKAVRDILGNMNEWCVSSTADQVVYGEKTFADKTTFKKGITIGEATLSWDADNQCIKLDKGLYSESFVSAGGLGENLNVTEIKIGGATLRWDEAAQCLRCDKPIIG